MIEMADINRALEPLRRRVRMIASRAVLKMMSDAFTAQIKGLAGESRDGAEIFQQYGFRSIPLGGSEGILLSLGGNRDHTVVICVDDRRIQIDLKGGETAMYTDEGDSLILKRGRIAELTTQTFVVKASEKVRFETPLVESTGQMVDLCDTNPVTISQLREAHVDHTHHVNAPNSESQPPTQGL